MDPQPDPTDYIFVSENLLLINSYIYQLISLILLLILSGRVSGAEVAYLSLDDQDFQEVKKEDKRLLFIKHFINNPKKILALILVANNFINVGIVLLSTYLLNFFFNFSSSPILGFVVNVVLITFIILMVGEIIPKVQAYRNPMDFALKRSRLLKTLQYIFGGVSNALIYSTRAIEKRLMSKINPSNFTVEELSNAIDMTQNTSGKDNLLKNIISFGTKEAADIMTPRVDMFSIDFDTPYKELRHLATQSSFSRIPIIQDSSDNIVGILYVKDFLLFDEDVEDPYNWQNFLHEVYYVSENKLIDSLLNEFKNKKKHLAIVADEYGGTAGLITLEDVLEEIVGEIEDEFDTAQVSNLYTKVNDNTYLMDGKISLDDLLEITQLPPQSIESFENQSETLAGLFIEIYQDFPKINTLVKTEYMSLKITKLDARRIKQIQVTIQ